MEQAFASDNSKKSIFSRLRFSNHRGFFSIFFTVFTLLFIVLIYSGLQQQKVYKSRASEMNNNICNVATNAVCGNSIFSSNCAALSFGCCKVENNTCVKDTVKNIKCDVLPMDICGSNQNGIDLSTICQWNTAENKCVDKTSISPTLSPITTESPPPSTQSANVELNLKLLFQGINSIPKTKNELIVKVKLIDEENREKINDNSIFTADDNGIWSGNVSFQDVDLSQKYYLLIKGPMHIQKKICTIEASDTDTDYYSCQLGNITLLSGVNDFDFSKVKMFVGDVPSPTQNGVANAEDIKVVTDALSLPVDQRQSEEILNNLDFNLDGIVSTQDLSLILGALKTKADEK